MNRTTTTQDNLYGGLWRPITGGPEFERIADHMSEALKKYPGFTVFGPTDEDSQEDVAAKQLIVAREKLTKVVERGIAPEVYLSDEDVQQAVIDELPEITETMPLTANSINYTVFPDTLAASIYLLYGRKYCQKISMEEAAILASISRIAKKQHVPQDSGKFFNIKPLLFLRFDPANQGVSPREGRKFRQIAEGISILLKESLKDENLILSAGGVIFPKQED